MAERKWFPMIGGAPIPWEFAEAIYAMYSELFGENQSLTRIAERGGFGYSEIEHMAKRLKVLEERKEVERP